MYPDSIKKLISQFSKLPSIGPKTAERLVFYLLKKPQSELIEFGDAIENIKGKIKVCSNCFDFSESDPCSICSDPRRNSRIVCVVAKPQDIQALEKTASFSGQYHLLGGNIDAMENNSELKVKELINKINQGKIDEIIFGLNPDMEGETTILYLSKLIKQNPKIKITRLARGLPMGADLEYADEITLENALKSRQEV